jgi:hypothetical protein
MRNLILLSHSLKLGKRVRRVLLIDLPHTFPAGKTTHTLSYHLSKSGVLHT